MGKFDFQSYQEELSNKQLRFDHFSPIKPGGFGKSRGDTRPIITVSRTGISANRAATEQLTKYGKYVEFMIQSGCLVMRVLTKKSEYSYTLTVSDKGYGANTGAQKIVNELQENTDSVNLNLYRYKFVLNNDEENIFYIELNNPDGKERKNR